MGIQYVKAPDFLDVRHYETFKDNIYAQLYEVLQNDNYNSESHTICNLLSTQL